MLVGYAIIAILYLVLALSKGSFSLTGMLKLDAAIYLAIALIYAGLAKVIDFGFELE